MSKTTSLTLLALLLTASGAMARENSNPYFTDFSKSCGGYDCNSQAGQRAFWDSQQEHHGQ